MPVSITKNDMAVQIAINIDYYRHASGPMSVAALRLAQLWATQLPEEKRREIEQRENISLAVDLTGF